MRTCIFEEQRDNVAYITKNGEKFENIFELIRGLIKKELSKSKEDSTTKENDTDKIIGDIMLESGRYLPGSERTKLRLKLSKLRYFAFNEGTHSAITNGSCNTDECLKADKKSHWIAK
jgi:hypothetical protein